MKGRRVGEDEFRERIRNAVRAAAHHGLTCKKCRVPVINRDGLLARPGRLCDVGKTLRAAVAAAEAAIMEAFGGKNGTGVDGPSDGV